ncbi:hypothetical protein EGV01_15980 [Pseudomonas syringae pv. theae]|nr:hypothetical protein [Pseudomonas syringae pv. theae]
MLVAQIGAGKLFQWVMAINGGLTSTVSRRGVVGYSVPLPAFSLACAFASALRQSARRVDTPMPS